MTVALSELDTKFKYDVANEPGGENIKVCFACGLCTASCPVADIDVKFNPRRIIRNGALGDEERSPVFGHYLVLHPVL